MRDVRLAGTRVYRHSTVFKFATSPSTESLRHELQHTVESPSPLAAGQHDLRLRRAALHPGLDADTRETEIGVERPHPHRHRRPWRHAGRRLTRLLDRDLRSQVGQHLDPVFEFFHFHLLAAGQRRAAGLEEQPVGSMFGCRPVGIHLQHERPCRPRQIARPHLELQVAAAVASEIDPGRLERLVALGNDHDACALDRPQVTLPGHRLALATHIGRKLIAHLAHEQRGRIDQRHADRLAPRIAGVNREHQRLIQPAGRVGKHGRVPLPSP